MPRAGHVSWEQNWKYLTEERMGRWPGASLRREPESRGQGPESVWYRAAARAPEF